ncbi:MAG: tetratricopeptide repeat protein [Phormidesmis sp.]
MNNIHSTHSPTTESIAEVTYMQAVESFRSGELDIAEAKYRQVLQAHPTHALAQVSLGFLLEGQARFPAAVEAYQATLKLELEPSIAAQTFNNLGNIFKDQQQLEQAAAFYRKALALESDRADTWFHLGLTFSELGQLDHAAKAFSETIRHAPTFTEAHLQLAIVLQEKGQLSAAQLACQQYLQAMPECDYGLTTLGNLEHALGNLESAVRAYQKAIELNPNNINAYCNLGNVYREQYDLDSEKLMFQQALAVVPDLAEAKIGLCIGCLPIIYSSAEEVLHIRAEYQQQLAALAAYFERLSFEEKAAAATCVGISQPFYLAYQGFNDRDLQKTYGSMIAQLMACRYPQWTQQQTQPNPMPKLKAGEKIRVGFVSRFFYNHSNWKIPMKGWVENLNKADFELFGYHTGPDRDAQTEEAVKAFDKFLQRTWSVEQWAQQIQTDDLHVLICPEFGMDPMTIKLGCLKLAPIQMTFGGHPETSGLPTVDYHLSSELMEPAEAESHYTEKLINLPNLAFHYTPLDIPAVKITRQEIGVRDDEIMFWCCQSLFKYLPQHDDVFPRIAKELPNSKFVFITSSHSQHITDVFRQRLQMAFAAVGLAYEAYCLFLPRMDSGTFAGAMALADIFLDSIGWSGDNTAMESTAFNLPIVTWPGSMMRGRHSMAILQMMGVEETIAASKAEYIEMAVCLGQHADYRQRVSQQIENNKHKLYEDIQPVRALEEFLIKAVNKPRFAQDSAVSELLQQATQSQRQHNFSQANRAFQQVLEIQPNHPEALFGVGMLAQQTGDYTEAIAYLEKITQASGDADCASEATAASLTSSTMTKTWFSLGNLYQAQGDLAKAAIAYRQALTLRPDAVSIYNNLGYVLQQQSQWDEAIDCYQKALEIQPGCAEAESNLGDALQATGQLSPTQHSYYAAINLRLGQQQYQQGHRAEALAYCQRAVELQPDLEEAQQWLKTVHALPT